MVDGAPFVFGYSSNFTSLNVYLSTHKLYFAENRLKKLVIKQVILMILLLHGTMVFRSLVKTTLQSYTTGYVAQR